MSSRGALHVTLAYAYARDPVQSMADGPRTQMDCRAVGTQSPSGLTIQQWPHEKRAEAGSIPARIIGNDSRLVQGYRQCGNTVIIPAHHSGLH